MTPTIQACCPESRCAAHEQGSEVTYNTLVKVASYAGDSDRAMAVLEEMAAAGCAPTTAVWGSLLVACGKVCTARQPACSTCPELAHHVSHTAKRKPRIA